MSKLLFCYPLISFTRFITSITPSGEIFAAVAVMSHPSSSAPGLDLSTVKYHVLERRRQKLLRNSTRSHDILDNIKIQRDE
jgi:hypothetical protein